MGYLPDCPLYPAHAFMGKDQFAKEGSIPPFGILFLSLDRQREVRRDFTGNSLICSLICLLYYGLISKWG